MAREPSSKIVWSLNLEHRFPRGAVSPDPVRFEPLGFPPPWPDRPWIYANMIGSQNGIVAWKRRARDDDPIRVIAGGDLGRPARRADVQLMRYLRASADAVSVGAQTLRDQPELICTLGDGGSDLGEVLEGFRKSQGRRPLPLQITYTREGALDLDAPMFRTPGVEVIVGTTAGGARRLRSLGSEGKGVVLLVAGEDDLDAAALVALHRRLFADFGVRYLDCEGGATIVDALHEAGLVDEIFVTTTEVIIDPDRHEGIKRLFPLTGARLIAEGRTPSDPGYAFRRWRINER